MFENVVTYCKMPSEQAAIDHVAMLSKQNGILETGTQHTDKHGWRSWFKKEQLVHDVILPSEGNDND